MSAQFNNRSPRRKGRFCWAREITPGVVRYRLFRRELTGRVQPKTCTFHPGMSRSQIAEILNQERHALRDRVDEIDLRSLGVA